MKALRVLAGTFLHQVVRRHKVVHVLKFKDGLHRDIADITRDNANLVSEAWVHCSCGRLWVLV